MHRRQLIQTFLSITLGTFLEWFDFSAFSALDHIVKKQFRIDGTVYWSIFALGFISRPLGAVIFGWLGDTAGRRSALMFSVVGVALPSTLMGCLPTYAMIGQAAPILLAILRLCQGLALGGEYGSALVYIQEVSPAGREGLLANSMASSSKFATIVGNLVVILLEGVLTADQMALWGWRLPFLSSIFTGGVALLLRKLMPESEEFMQRRAELQAAEQQQCEAEGSTLHADSTGAARAAAAALDGTNATDDHLCSHEGTQPHSPCWDDPRHGVNLQHGGLQAADKGLQRHACGTGELEQEGNTVRPAAEHSNRSSSAPESLLDLAEHHRVPLLDLVLLHGEALLLHITYLTFNAALFYTVTTWLPSTLRSIGVAPIKTQGMLITNLLVLLSSAVLTGWLLDRGWRSLHMVWAATWLGIGGGFALCAVVTLAHRQLGGVWVMMAVMCAIAGVLNGNYPSVGVGLYPPECRLSGMNMGYNLAFGCFGGLTPVMISVIRTTLTPSLSVFAAAWWLLAVSGLSLSAQVLLMRRHPWCNYTRTQMWRQEVLPPWLQGHARSKGYLSRSPSSESC